MARRFGTLRSLCSGEDAATAAEYVLMAALIGLACLTAVASLGGAVNELLLRVVGGLG